MKRYYLCVIIILFTIQNADARGTVHSNAYGASGKIDYSKVSIESAHGLFNPCENFLSVAGLIRNVDLQITNVTMTGEQRDVQTVIEIANLGRDDYELSACMNKESYVSIERTNMCTGYAYSGNVSEELQVPIQAGYHRKVSVTFDWNLPGSGLAPACDAFFLKATVDWVEHVTESNESNNSYGFCYHVDSGIYPNITTLEECADEFLATAGSS